MPKRLSWTSWYLLKQHKNLWNEKDAKNAWKKNGSQQWECFINIHTIINADYEFFLQAVPFVLDGPEFSLKAKTSQKVSRHPWLWSSRMFSEPIQDNCLVRVSYEVSFQGSCHRNGPAYMDELCTPPMLGGGGSASRLLMHVLHKRSREDVDDEGRWMNERRRERAAF